MNIVSIRSRRSVVAHSAKIVMSCGQGTFSSNEVGLCHRFLLQQSVPWVVSEHFGQAFCPHHGSDCSKLVAIKPGAPTGGDFYAKSPMEIGTLLYF